MILVLLVHLIYFVHNPKISMWHMHMMAKNVSSFSVLNVLVVVCSSAEMVVFDMVAFFAVTVFQILQSVSMSSGSCIRRIRSKQVV